ncbi:MAG: protein TolR [Proteobacteria bacterium]|nr:protein TolR [Pseudomonadota bacterium]
MGANASTQMGVGSRMGRRPGRTGSNRRVMGEINVTPFVDVMLVLLVIFMVTAPLVTSGVQVDLPETSSAQVEGQDEPLSISVKKDGSVYLQETRIKTEEIAPRLKAIVGEKKETRIFVYGDKNVDYGRVMQVVSLINEAGFTKVAFITDSAGAPGGQ